MPDRVPASGRVDGKPQPGCSHADGIDARLKERSHNGLTLNLHEDFSDDMTDDFGRKTVASVAEFHEPIVSDHADRPST